MIVDNYCGKISSFDGTYYTPLEDTNNMIIGQDLETKLLSFEYLFGMIHFSSPYTFTILGKKDMIRKNFTPAIHNIQQMRVKTSKLTQKKDMYAIVKIEKIENNIILCDVVTYIEDNNINKNFMEYICSCGWKRTKKTTQLFSNCCDIDLTPEREDYTNKIIYSIDPDGCLDIDDALHCEYIEQTQEYEIGIHIADVSSFIEENSHMDNELKNRIETIYDYKKKPIHMIPEELSIQYISLLEKSKKRAFSVIIKAKINNSNIEIVDVKFKKTFICVKANLTYEKAQDMINVDVNIKNLYDIGILLKNKTNNELFFENEIYDTHQMVAIYMIYANKLVGEFLQQYDKNNVLLRVHKNKHNVTNNITNNVENNVENNIKILVQKNSLCKKEQARYQKSSVDSKHCGLNLDFYTHMTSPIRRYADIIIHRQLWNAINNKNLNVPETKTIFLMNYYKKIYKHAERFMKICEISELLNNACVQTEAYIVSINDDKFTMRLYVPKFDLDYDIPIIDKKLLHTKNIEISESKIIIKNKDKNKDKEKNKNKDKDNKTELEYVLFQKINIKMISSNEPFTKLYFQILFI